jgi:hypothetical protein
MLSALIHAVRSYSALHLAAQPIHQRYVQHGPLVLVSALRNIPTPTTDRDRTVLRRSEPSSRAALMGEQPNPVDMSSWGRSACYPRSTFYPLSDTLSMQWYRITLADFRP